MESYVTLKSFAEMSGLSVQEVKDIATKRDALTTINKGSKANIYVNVDVMMDCLEQEIIETLKDINGVQEDKTLCI